MYVHDSERELLVTNHLELVCGRFKLSPTTWIWYTMSVQQVVGEPGSTPGGERPLTALQNGPHISYARQADPDCALTRILHRLTQHEIDMSVARILTVLKKSPISGLKSPTAGHRPFWVPQIPNPLTDRKGELLGASCIMIYKCRVA